jgi:hypothetical protein
MYPRNGKWCVDDEKTVKMQFSSEFTKQKYRITAIVTVKTGIIVSSAASPTGRAVILVIIYVETFITDGIVLAVASYNVFDIILTDIFHHWQIGHFPFDVCRC